MTHPSLKPILLHHSLRFAGDDVPFSRRATWCLSALSGRLVELSGDGASAVLTMATALVRDAQTQHEPVVWIFTHSLFYPPDVVRNGIDVSALLLIRVREIASLFRATDRVLRSGAFGLVVLDLEAHAAMPLPVQTRFSGLAEAHGCALLCLTRKPPNAPSLGSLISLHAMTERTRCGDGHFAVSLKASKDKRCGPGWTYHERYHGPAGVR